MTQSIPTLFLSHAGPDRSVAIELKRRLLASPDAQAAGLKVWLDVDDLDEGKPWQPQLEAAIGAASAFSVIAGSNGIRNWVRAETDLALSRAIKHESFRIIPILQDGGSDSLTPFVKRYHAVRDPLNNPDALQSLLRAALGLDKNGMPVLTDEPFPGLRSMSEDWADRFFGRRTETDEVLALLRRHRAVTIVADSGAGKSSLAMAGVGHAWRGGALRTDRPRADDAAIWHVITMRPAENPVEQLRDAIESAATQLGCDQAAITSLRQGLTSDPAFALRCGLDPATTHTLLIIDQAEELVTLTPRYRRPEFGRLIAALADAMGDRLSILITLRSDHLNLVGGVEGLGPMVRPPEAQFNLKQPVDLAEIVRGPLTLAGHRDEAEQQNLIDRLRKDLSNRPGDLALAQMTLSLAWRDRGKHGGLLGAYAMNGGALVALGREAERIERTLHHDDATRLMPIFIRLIRLSDVDTGATRRIAARKEFNDGQNCLINRLAGEDCGRLIQTSATHVEIAHESLIKQWPQLHEYLIEHASGLRILSDLMRHALGWATSKESSKHLTTLADEERFQALRQSQGEWLSVEEHRFLDWSKAEHQRIRNDREKTARRIRSGAYALAALLLMLIGVGWFAYDRDQSAQVAEAKARSEAEIASIEAARAGRSRVDALALLALSQAETNPVDALKLVLGAWPESNAG
ncbi:MAG: toll/interleukin-1 receptor domain-containing protein, partial [Spiribacter salinus]